MGVGNERKSSQHIYDIISSNSEHLIYENFVVFALADDEVICQVGLNTGEETAVRL